MVSAHSSPASAISSQPVGVAVRMTRHRCRRWPQLHCIVENADSQEEKDIPCPAENLYSRSRGEKGFGLIFLVESQGYWFFFKYHPPRSTVPFKISPPPRHTAMTTVLPSLCSSQAGLLHGLTCLLPMRSIPYVSQLLVCASQIHWTASTNFCLGKYLKLCHSPPSGFLF